MMPGSEGPTTAVPAHDSIELEVTGAREPALFLAAEAARAMACPDESGLVFSVREDESFAWRRTARIDFVCNVTFALAVLGIVVAFLWPAPNRLPPVPVITSTSALDEVTPAEPAEPQSAHASFSPSIVVGPP